jgi:hypothetical protein
MRQISKEEASTMKTYEYHEGKKKARKKRAKKTSVRDVSRDSGGEA